MAVNSAQWLDALKRLKAKRAEIDKQIAVIRATINREREEVIKKKDLKIKAERERRALQKLERCKMMAKMVLVEGLKATDAGKIMGLSASRVSDLVRTYCYRANPELYKRGCRIESNGCWSYGCKPNGWYDFYPLMTWLREHSAEFFGNEQNKIN